MDNKVKWECSPSWKMHRWSLKMHWWSLKMPRCIYHRRVSGLWIQIVPSIQRLHLSLFLDDVRPPHVWYICFSICIWVRCICIRSICIQGLYKRFPVNGVFPAYFRCCSFFVTIFHCHPSIGRWIDFAYSVNCKLFWLIFNASEPSRLLVGFGIRHIILTW